MSKKIPEQLIEEIRSQSNIVDVISEYMQLTKRGRNWFGLCPFHGEQTPSFSVSEDKQIFHCFGCGAGGNAITFIMDIENIAFPDAVVKLGERAGVPVDIEVSSSASPSREVSSSEKNMLEAHQLAVEFYHHLLINTEDGEEALQYLYDRGFTEQIIEKYQIGWALPSWDALVTFLEKKEMPMQQMVECGLIIQREHEVSYFDRFRGRIMFPIRDDNGKVIAFSGRILKTDSGDAKYMNSPESPIFHKSEVLYNIDQARASMRKTRQVVLMEGFVDVLAAVNAGVPNVVATMGTSLTSQHIQKLKRLVEQITICYDGDSAGMDGAKRSAQLLKDQRLKVNVAVLPDKLDPDDYIRQYGQEAFKNQIIGKPHAYMAFTMLHARRNKNFQFENDILQYIQEVMEELIKVTSPVERDLYMQQLAQETAITLEALEAQLRQLQATAVKRVKEEQTVSHTVATLPIVKKTLTATERAERLLLSHMLHNAHVVDKVLKESNQPFIHDEYSAVFIRLIGFYEEYHMADYQRFVEVIEDSQLRKIVMEAALVERAPESAEAEIGDCLKHLSKHRIVMEIESLKQQQAEAEKVHEYKQAMDAMQKIIHLRRTLATM